MYIVKVITDLRGDISKAVCGCPAGVDGRCNHLAATLFAIEDKQNNEVFTSAANTAGALSHQETNVPCSSRPCQWNLLQKGKINAELIQSLKFQKHGFGKEKKRSVIPQKDVRAPHERTMSDSDLKSFYDEVKQVEKKTGKKIGLSFILPHVPPQNNDPEPAAQDPHDSELN